MTAIVTPTMRDRIEELEAEVAALRGLLREARWCVEMTHGKLELRGRIDAALKGEKP